VPEPGVVPRWSNETGGLVRGFGAAGAGALGAGGDGASLGAVGGGVGGLVRGAGVAAAVVLAAETPPRRPAEEVRARFACRVRVRVRGLTARRAGPAEGGTRTAGAERAEETTGLSAWPPPPVSPRPAMLAIASKPIPHRANSKARTSSGRGGRSVTPGSASVGCSPATGRRHGVRVPPGSER
jgi:hypothetical protein